MLKYVSVVSCNKCLRELRVIIDKEDFNHTIGTTPTKVYNFLNESLWKYLPNGKHICPDCEKSHSAMIKQIKKIKRDYWEG
jgi:hypothetical protein